MNGDLQSICFGQAAWSTCYGPGVGALVVSGANNKAAPHVREAVYLDSK
jgi:hypothetical protein